jgi:hypothetical protein
MHGDVPTVARARRIAVAVGESREPRVDRDHMTGQTGNFG